MSNKYQKSDSPVSALKNESARQRWELFHRAIAHAKESNNASLAEADAPYHAFVASQGVTTEDLGGLRATFTPLHGVGHTSVLPVLRGRGLDVHPVEPQLDPDGGNFSTVDSANPEDPAALAALD